MSESDDPRFQELTSSQRILAKMVAWSKTIWPGMKTLDVADLAGRMGCSAAQLRAKLATVCTVMGWKADSRRGTIDLKSTPSASGGTREQILNDMDVAIRNLINEQEHKTRDREFWTRIGKAVNGLLAERAEADERKRVERIVASVSGRK